MRQHKRARALKSLLTAVMLLVASMVSVTVTAAPAMATTCGSVLATVNGVDIKSNGAYEASSSGDSCGGSAQNTTMTPGGATVTTGYEWQCVEFVNRYYAQKGWISSQWFGNGSTLKDSLPSGLTYMANGLITSIAVGDVVTLNYSTFGHAGVVSGVSGNSITIANQNAGAGLWGYATFNPSNGTLTSEYGGGFSTQGVIHAVANTTSNFLGPFSSAPSTFADSSGNLQVFVTTNGGLNHYSKVSGSSWGGEVAATGGFTSATSSFVDSSGTEHVFVETSGGLDHFTKSSSGSWNGEVVTTGSFTKDPSALVDSSGNLHVFVDTTGGLNHYVKAPGSSWAGEVVASGSFTSAPSAFVDTGYGLHVFVTTSGGLNRYVKVPWSGWNGEVVASGSFTSSPAAFFGNGALQVFILTSGGMNHYVNAGSWAGEVVASGSFTSAPSAFVDASGNLHAFITASSSLVHYVKYAGGGWAGEMPETASFTSATSSFVDSSGNLHVFVDTTGGLNHYVRYTNGAWAGEVIA